MTGKTEKRMTCHEGVPCACAGVEARGLEQQSDQLAQLEHHTRSNLCLREHLHRPNQALSHESQIQEICASQLANVAIHFSRVSAVLSD